jgi:Ca-activated chloride channel homolog
MMRTTFLISRLFCVSAGFLILLPWSFTQKDHQLRKEGDAAYIKQDFNKAEESYRKALEKKQSETTKFNLGNAIMEQNRPDEAITYYEDATKKASLPDANSASLNSKAWYNLGNAYYQKKDYENSVKAYKESLKRSPNEIDTKKNLALAKKQLIKQQQQQQQDQKNKDQNKDKKQNQKQDQNQQQQKQQQQQQPQNKQSQEQQQQQMTREEAEQLLQYTEREDQRVQQKLVNKNAKKNPPKKDW